MASTSSAVSASIPRHDYYQTETQVIVSFYIKGCQQDDVQVDVQEDALSLSIKAPSPETQADLSPLFANVDTANTGVRVLSTKIEVSLQKQQPGHHWPKLMGTLLDATPVKQAEPSSNSNQPTAATSSKSSVPRSRSKWDSFKDDDEKTDEGDIDSFFKQLYAGADDDTRRAMMKSYQESGGTALSTNWADVKKGRVETNPPAGMEARKWGA